MPCNDARDAARMAQLAGNPRDEALARDIVATVLITTGRHEAAFTEATRALSLTGSLGAGLFHAGPSGRGKRGQGGRYPAGVGSLGHLPGTRARLSGSDDPRHSGPCDR